jgi:hypothetical protein
VSWDDVGDKWSKARAEAVACTLWGLLYWLKPVGGLTGPLTSAPIPASKAAAPSSGRAATGAATHSGWCSAQREHRLARRRCSGIGGIGRVGSTSGKGHGGNGSRNRTIKQRF